MAIVATGSADSSRHSSSSKSIISFVTKLNYLCLAHRLRHRSKVPAALTLLISLLVASCTYDVHLEPKLEVLKQEGTELIPITIGVYYSPEFLAYEQKETIAGGSKVRFAIGEATARFFDQVFAKLFRNVKRVDQRPPMLQTSEAIEAVIEPRIESLTTRNPAFGWAGTWNVEITYLFTLYTLEGEPVVTWYVTGIGHNTSTTFTWVSGGTPLAAEAANRAIEEAARNFLEGFAQVPEVRRWLRGRGLRGTATWILGALR